MENTDLGILFKKITITSILKAISSFFLLETKINYSPPYQRGYIWTKAKATYLIESILLHGEIPPIVLYKKSEAHLEVIDGSPLLVRAALDAVRQWVYKPTLLSGEAVEVIAPITVTFSLNR